MYGQPPFMYPPFMMPPPPNNDWEKAIKIMQKLELRQEKKKLLEEEKKKGKDKPVSQKTMFTLLECFALTTMLAPIIGFVMFRIQLSLIESAMETMKALTK